MTCALKAAMVETSRRLTFDVKRSPVRGFILLHETHIQVGDRLKQFSKLVNACPDLLEKHFDQLVNQEDEMVCQNNHREDFNYSKHVIVFAF